MKHASFLIASLAMTFYLNNTFAQQVYDADNGITASGTGTTRKVSLGGNLTGATSIGLNSYNLNLTGTGNLLLGGPTDDGHRLQVNGTVSAKGFKLPMDSYLYFGDINTSLRFNSSNMFEFSQYSGRYSFSGMTDFIFEMKHPSNGSAYFYFPANKQFAIKHGLIDLMTANNLSGSTSVRVGSATPAYSNDKGVDLYLIGSKGGDVSSGYDGGNVYIDAGQKGGATKKDGNIFIGTQYGNVGIGTATPANRVSIAGLTSGTSGLQFTQLNSSSTAGTGNGKVLSLDATGNVILVNGATGGTAGWSFTGNNSLTAGSFIGTTDATELILKSNNVEGIRIGTNGNIGIGTAQITNAGYKLYVEGNIRTRKVRVDSDANWADYVFEKDYQLLPLAALEKFVQEHHHLPGVPSAAEVKKDGLDLGDNQAVLLKKIEELTLYIIEQDKKLKALQELVESSVQKPKKKKAE